ncbi:flavin-containing monooxygenase [Lentzea flava]|nr:NAD(P)/FAD-dependent oxidoreductase [Lentzea flava]
MATIVARPTSQPRWPNGQRQGRRRKPLTSINRAQSIRIPKRFTRTTHNYSNQSTILEYVKHCTEQFGVRAHIEFKTEISQAWFDEKARVWRLRTTEGDEHAARVAVTAVGQLNQPRMPELADIDQFVGTSFHSARWNHGHDLTGRSVAVIGNGCSAAQFVPKIAEQVQQLHIFQRSPKWIIPKWSRKITPLGAHPVPQRISRAGWYASAEVIAHSPINHGMWGRVLTAAAKWHLLHQISELELRAKLTPNYPFGCNRMILSNDYYPTLTRDNVTLVTEPIERVTPTGIATADGRLRTVDTIIYATGFHSTHFLAPLQITGPGGSLHARWREAPDAYLGMMVPGFPNFFMLYGPNSSSASNSVIAMLESQARYVASSLDMIGDNKTVDVTPEAFDDYQKALRRRLASTVWTEQCTSWYKNGTDGHITNLWPRRVSTYRWLTRHPERKHLVISSSVGGTSCA